MTDVSFGTVLEAFRAKGDVGAEFCSEFVLKKLQGKVDICFSKNVNNIKMYDSLELIKRVPGRLRIFVRIDSNKKQVIPNCQQQTYMAVLNELHNRTYISFTGRGLYLDEIVEWLPGNTFSYLYDPETRCSALLYRPARLHGRHVVDVLRAVCGPADVSEAELDRVRREVTERAENIEEEEGGGIDLKGIWLTKWMGSLVIVKV